MKRKPVTPNAWTWAEFEYAIGQDILSDHCFFRRVDNAIQDNPLLPWSDWRWLALIRTDTLWAWVRAKGEFSTYSPHTYHRKRSYHPLHRVLLRRFLLHLGHRINPPPLIEFWDWLITVSVTPFQSGERLADVVPGSIWHDLPLTLEGSSISDQELMFADKLRHVAQRLRSNIPAQHFACWIADDLDVIADNRHAGPGSTKPTATFGVVFGLRSDTTSSVLRSGLLIEFTLTGPSKNAIIQAPWLFDEEFLNSIQAAKLDLTPDVFCLLDHEWRTLLSSEEASRPVFVGGSGAMAVRVATHLSLGGPSLEHKSWTLPPWLVISAAYDAERRTCDTVTGHPAKAEALVEEGGRVLLTLADPQDDEASCRTAHAILRNHPCETYRNASHHLYVHPLEPSFQQYDRDKINYVGIVNVIRNENWCWQLNEDYQHKFRQTFPDAADRPATSNIRALHLGFNYEEYVEPTYLYDEFLAACARLPNDRGYILWSAPSGIGKTTLMRAPLAKWPKEFGAVLPYSVLPGRPEHPLDFCDALRSEAHTRLDLQVSFQPAGDSPDALRASLGSMIEQILDHLPDLDSFDDDGRSTERLVIAIDGANYIGSELVAHASIYDVLPAPEDLPNGCIILLSTVDTSLDSVSKLVLKESRNTAAGGENSCFEQISFDEQDAKSNEALLQSYFQERLSPSWHPHISTFVELSERRFLYAAMLADIYAGTIPIEPFSLIDASDDSVWARYLEFLRNNKLKARPYRSCKQGPERFEQWHKIILCLLAAAQEPISTELLMAWLDRLNQPTRDIIRSREELHLALEEMHRVVRPDQLRPDLLPSYSLAHEELRAWLVADNNQRWSEAIRKNGHERIVQTNVSSEISQNPNLAVEEYSRHLPTHCMELKLYQESWQLLQNAISREVGEWHAAAIRRSFDADSDSLVILRTMQLSRYRDAPVEWLTVLRRDENFLTAIALAVQHVFLRAVYGHPYSSQLWDSIEWFYEIVDEYLESPMNDHASPRAIAYNYFEITQVYLYCLRHGRTATVPNHIATVRHRSNIRFETIVAAHDYHRADIQDDENPACYALYHFVSLQQQLAFVYIEMAYREIDSTFVTESIRRYAGRRLNISGRAPLSIAVDILTDTLCVISAECSLFSTEAGMPAWLSRIRAMRRHGRVAHQKTGFGRILRRDPSLLRALKEDISLLHMVKDCLIPLSVLYDQLDESEDADHCLLVAHDILAPSSLANVDEIDSHLDLLVLMAMRCARLSRVRDMERFFGLAIETVQHSQHPEHVGQRMLAATVLAYRADRIGDANSAQKLLLDTARWFCRMADRHSSEMSPILMVHTCIPTYWHLFDELFQSYPAALNHLSKREIALWSRLCENDPNWRVAPEHIEEVTELVMCSSEKNN